MARKFKSRMKVVVDSSDDENEVINEELDTVQEENDPSIDYPKTAIIIPFRERQEHLNVYMNHMKWIMDEKGWEYNKDYTYIVSSQLDQRPFNRGAMKNLGFYYAREKWPEHYKKMNFVFNDVDIMPGYPWQVDYETNPGTVKHSYGFDFCLGGLVTINGDDFERINGYPNYWGWGYEDNMLEVRCKRANIQVDREKFWKAGDKEFIRLNHGQEKNVDKQLKAKYYNTPNNNGLSSLKEVFYFDSDESFNDSKYNMINFVSWEIPEPIDNENIVSTTDAGQTLGVRRPNRQRRMFSMSRLMG
jgi:hypothetical protein